MKIDAKNCAESPRSSVLLGTSETPYQSLVDLREESATPVGRGVISPKPGVLNLSSFMHIDTTEEYGSYELGFKILTYFFFAGQKASTVGLTLGFNSDHDARIQFRGEK